LELKHYASHLWRWSWLIALSALVAGAAAFVVSSRMVPVYQATATLLINAAPIASRAQDAGPSESLMRTYATLLQTRPVLEAVIAELQLSMDARDVDALVSVTPVRMTQLLSVNAQSTDPQLAADIANELAKVAIQQNRELQAERYAVSKQNIQQELVRVQEEIDRASIALDGPGAQLSPERNRLQDLLGQYRSSYANLLRTFEEVRLAETSATDRLTIVEIAQPPRTPVRPSRTLYTLLAGMAGAMLAIGLVVVGAHRDRSVKSMQEVERLIGIPSLAAIASTRSLRARARLISLPGASDRTVEAFRMLAVNTELSTADNPFRTLLVTSSSAAEGKSITAANLAIAMAESGKRVILVDTNLRRPTLHQIFEQPRDRGLTTLLKAPPESRVDDFLVPTGVANLRLLPSGSPAENPVEPLVSSRMSDLIDELTACADVVIFDSPALLAAVDPTLLARYCEATLLVVRAGATAPDSLTRARQQLAYTGTRLLGAVLYGMPTPNGGHGGYSSEHGNGHGSGDARAAVALWERTSARE
jgi:capsular exopolysaccharide synthesis family protein